MLVYRCNTKSKLALLPDVLDITPGGGGGALEYFLGGYVPPETPNWHPVLKKKFP